MQKVSNVRYFYGLLAVHMVTPDAATRVRQRIAQLLDDQGMTQRAFAKKVGHGDQWASNLLSGLSNLTWDDLDTVARVLGVPPSEIVRVAEDAWELTPTEMRMVRALRMLPPVVRDHLVMFADYLIGATPDEVVLLKRVRRLTPEQLRRIEHYMDVELLGEDTESSQASHVDLKATTATRPLPARRRRAASRP